MNNIYTNRLLKVARSLRESPNPKDFTMTTYGNSCGTPACALGHYASREDLQSSFTLKKRPYEEEEIRIYSKTLKDEVYFNDDEVIKHFELTVSECHELFGGQGCGYAKTVGKAARYIENFIAKKLTKGTK